ncbi:MAG TPA: hypothetical protein VGN69_00535 [Solirubrobacteraceae bacterium]|nr:hypothetical protein [Solirubrobacteraceae bacterium]
MEDVAGAPESERARLSPAARLAAVALIGLMAIGSVMMWLGVPVFWLWLASRIVKSSQPTLGPYVMVLIGIPLSMVILGKLLARLNRVYGDLTGTTPRVKVRMPWMKSMRGERDSGRPRTILDVVMVCSVSIALVAFGIWFFVFAGSSLPT